MKKSFGKLGRFYEKHLSVFLGITSALFILQLIHLYWLTTHVVAMRLFGQSYFDLKGIWETFIVIVDYTEVPVIIATTGIYIHQLSKGFSWKPILMMLLLNSQWLHIFWITDEFVVAQFSGVQSTMLPAWLAWIAIGIDYLEIPVIYDTTRNFLISLKKKISE